MAVVVPASPQKGRGPPSQPNVTVVGAQQGVIIVPTGPQQSWIDSQWTFGLCGGDCGLCCYFCFFPACMMASTRSKYDRSNCCFNCLVFHGNPCSPCLLTNVIREGYGINGSCMEDICAAYWCCPCAVVRTAREVGLRGEITRNLGSVNNWDSSLLDCLKDIPGCVLSFFCFPCVSAKARSIYDSSNFCFNLLTMGFPGSGYCFLRNVIREGYGIDGNCCLDGLFSCVPILMCLDVARMYRDVKTIQTVAPSSNTVVVIPSAPPPPPVMQPVININNVNNNSSSSNNSANVTGGQANTTSGPANTTGGSANTTGGDASGGSANTTGGDASGATVAANATPEVTKTPVQLVEV
eukprot:TRINITY_DN21296_c0_g1_i1.p1 TRINITY_DN21296_c0_g1~~TRINITY_DN21296_c0_g1_i1.p1  ORF type:complete len:352 (+),score=30.71 TRINITY_DN21296_c0_g1_i1:205-1260(+)